MTIEKNKIWILKKRIEELEEYKDSTIGLYCTDRPDLIPRNIRHLFFRLKD